MSKMFDALRRAEEERRKKTSVNEEIAVPSSAQNTQSESENRSVVPPASKVEASADMSESFFRELGILINSIESTLKNKNRKALLFTSASEGEGTTTIAANYAKMLAMRGNEKVLLCEMNSRKPSLASLFSLNSSVGINDFLTGEKNLPSIVQDLKELQLHVAHIGKPDPAVLQLRLPHSFPKLVETAFSYYNTVIFDAPPITSSPETPIMSSFVDGVILVVRSGKTKREVVQRSMNAVSQLEGKILGVVMNRKKYYIPDFLYKRV